MKNQALFRMNVVSLAMNGICNKQDVSQQVQEIYGHGVSAQEVAFGEAFAVACAEQASRMVAEKELSLNDGAFHLYRTTRKLNDSEFSLGIKQFITKLKQKNPEFFGNDNQMKPELAEELKRVMSGQLKPVGNTIKP